MMPKSEVFNCDCIEFMRSLPDGHFDIAVCDPPFGAGNSEVFMDNGKRRFNRTGRFGKYHENVNTPPCQQQSWNRLKCGRRERYYYPPEQNEAQEGETRTDKCKRASGVGVTKAPLWDIAPPQEFFDELFRVSKNQIIWGGNYFMLPPTRCFLVWRKTNIPDRFSMAQAEYAWTSFQGNALVHEQTSRRTPHSGKFHPTEKPQELYGWIYRNFVEAGQTIFDPMMGSQASRIAAYKMGLDYVGCEIDKYYFDKGCEFFARECLGETKDKQGGVIKQLNLFEDL